MYYAALTRTISIHVQSSFNCILNVLICFSEFAKLAVQVADKMERAFKAVAANASSNIGLLQLV